LSTWQLNGHFAEQSFSASLAPSPIFSEHFSAPLISEQDFFPDFLQMFSFRLYFSQNRSILMISSRFFDGGGGGAFNARLSGIQRLKKVFKT